MEPAGQRHIIWHSSSALKPDLTPIPAFQQVADSVRDIRRGMATLLLKAAQPLPEPIAILYSPASLHTATMLGMKTAVSASTQSAVYFIAPYRYHFVSGGQVEKGVLMAKPYHALILPSVYALSDEQARAIKTFVKQGGLVVADIEPGLYTEHGAARKQGALNDVFGAGVAWECRSVGQGQALLLKRAFSDCSGTNRDNLARTTTALRKLFGPHEEWFQPVKAIKADGGRMDDLSVWAFTNGAAWYVGLDRSMDPATAEPVTLTFPTTGYIYDMRAGKFLGQSNSVTVALSWQPAVYAVLPYPVEGLTINGLKSQYRHGDRIRFETAVQRPAGRTERHVLHVDLVGPDGRELEFGRRNIVAEDGRAQIDIPLALNELTGEYRIRVTDVASGQNVERGLSIQ